MLELIHIEKSYDHPVIRDLSYTFQPGKLYVIKGVSGCGKSTLLNIIGGVEREFQGQVAWSKGKPSCGYIFQQSLLLSKFTVLENLQLLCKDAVAIENICARLHISELLSKYPEELSGGERQRVAIARALLGAPEVLLADEPTAALDEENARNIARLLGELRSPERCVIVATHEHCFDDLADEILHLHYGVIRQVERRSQPLPEQPKEPVPAGRKKRLGVFRYARRRNAGGLRLGKLLPLALAFLSVLLASTVQKNFSGEYLRVLQQRYPMDLLSFYGDTLDGFAYYDDLILYDNYTAEEGDVHAYYLMDRQDSVLGIDGMLLAGTFPESAAQVLVSREFAEAYFAQEDPADCVGAVIRFKGREFTISGVTEELTERTIERNLFVDTYYQRKIKENAIFIPYETMVQIGEKQESEFQMAVYRGLAENETVFSAMVAAMDGEMPSQFYSDVRAAQNTLNGFSKTFYLVLLVSYVTSCIFLVSIVQTELFYRRRELGYLQLFGIRRGRVWSMILAEHLLRLGGALIVAGACYGVAVLIYGGLTGSFLFFDVPTILTITPVLCGIYLLSVAVSGGVFLRRSILSLIVD